MFIKSIIQSRFIDIPILKSHKPHMQLNRNALDPHHIQRPHLIEMLWLSVATFATLPWVESMVSLLPNYTQYKICVKH